MMDGENRRPSFLHSHVFLGETHEQSERRTWAVIWLCGAMMLAEIVGGLLFGSIALVADAMNMSTHAGALLLTRARLGRLRSLSHLTVEVRVSP
jgi:Co/Zn/Cd efflux system component